MLAQRVVGEADADERCGYTALIADGAPERQRLIVKLQRILLLLE